MSEEILKRIALLETVMLARFVAVSEELETIKKMSFAAVPKTRRTKKIMEAEPGSERALRESREAAVLSMFERLAKLDRREKGRQGFNFRIVQSAFAEPWEIVPFSILKNRLQNRGAFAGAAAEIEPYIERMVVKGHFLKVPLYEAAVMARLEEKEAFLAPLQSSSVMLVTPDEMDRIEAAREAEERNPRQPRQLYDPDVLSDGEPPSRADDLLERYENATPEERARMSAANEPLPGTVDEDDEPLVLLDFDMGPRGEEPEIVEPPKRKRKKTAEEIEEEEYLARREAATRAADAEAEAAMEAQIAKPKTKPWILQK